MDGNLKIIASGQLKYLKFYKQKVMDGNLKIIASG